MCKTPADIAESLSFRQLNMFECVGRLNSLRKASEECRLSQPAVTQAVAKLEQLIGIALVDRNASGSYLNAAGEILYRRAARLFALLENALVELDVPGGMPAAAAIARRISRSQARSLIALVDGGSFAHAAETRGLSQTALQRAARDLEGHVRKPLYCRTAAGMMVTPAGIALGRKMKLATQEIEWGIKEIETMRGDFASQISIGALPFGGSVLLASILDAFVTSHEHADVKIINEGTSQMLGRLRAGEVEFVIGLVQETVADDLTNEAFCETPYSIVARRGHPLTRRDKITIDDLLEQDWVVGTEGASRRACFERLFAGTSGPRASIATCALPVIHHLLARSDRLTLMTSYELMHEDGDLLPLAFGPIQPLPSIGITMRANWLPTQLHLDFIDLLRSNVAGNAGRAVLRQVV
jgi:DNA-binding transcriptional LysR family regulator